MKKYFSLIKFSHTVFALPFALIGFFIGVSQQPESFTWQKLLLVLVCMVSARSAAMGFNRYADRAIDAKNPRTSMREIPAGVIAPGSALLFIIISCAIFVTATFFINRICFFLSPVALLVVLGYSYTKRFTWLAHFILGLGLSLAPVGAYLAVVGHFTLLPILISVIVLTWVSGFDIIYALQDEEFDKQEHLYSVPAWLGKKNALRLSFAVHLLTDVALIVVGVLGGFGGLYWAGAIIFLGLLIYQHSLVKPNDLSKVNLAFATTNGIASIVFATFVLFDIYFKH